MVNKEFLEKELKRCYKESLTPVRFTKDILPGLFKEFSNYRMTEHEYCCCGLKESCWVEVVEEGNWELTLDDVRWTIEDRIKNSKKYLYDARKYGGNRLHMFKDKDKCYIFIYLRDILKEDYHICFNNKIRVVEETEKTSFTEESEYDYYINLPKDDIEIVPYGLIIDKN